MKKMQGIVDPISLTFVLVLGIATLGTMAGGNSPEQEQLAQNTQTELTESADQSKTYLADN